jgi:hypothetical protein
MVFDARDWGKKPGKGLEIECIGVLRNNAFNYAWFLTQETAGRNPEKVSKLSASGSSEIMHSIIHGF